jgi:Ferritin-like domain
MPRTLTRTGFLAGGAAAGASLLVPGLARAATEDDLALLRLAASAELVTTAFYYRAAGSPALGAAERRAFRRARYSDQRHYSLLVRAIGVDAPVKEDFDIGFRPRTFGTRRRIAETGSLLERAVLGIHLSAAAAISTPELRLFAARLAASEGRHLALLTQVAGGDIVGAPLPDPIDVERASEVLAPYWSGA